MWKNLLLIVVVGWLMGVTQIVEQVNGVDGYRTLGGNPLVPLEYVRAAVRATRREMLQALDGFILTPTTVFGSYNASCGPSAPCKNMLSCVSDACVDVKVNSTCNPSIPNACGNYGLKCVDLGNTPSLNGPRCIMAHQLSGQQCYPSYGASQCASQHCNTKSGTCDPTAL